MLEKQYGHGGHIVTVVGLARRYFDARKVRRRTLSEVTIKMVSMLKSQLSQSAPWTMVLSCMGCREFAGKGEGGFFPKEGNFPV